MTARRSRPPTSRLLLLLLLGSPWRASSSKTTSTPRAAALSRPERNPVSAFFVAPSSSSSSFGGRSSRAFFVGGRSESSLRQPAPPSSSSSSPRPSRFFLRSPGFVDRFGDGRRPNDFSFVSCRTMSTTAANGGDGDDDSVGREEEEEVRPTIEDDRRSPTVSPTPPALRRKSYATTVCLVPPPSATETWESLTEVRTELKDPGLYRWPPHANLLYPFLELGGKKKKKKKKKNGKEGDDVKEDSRVAADDRPNDESSVVPSAIIDDEVLSSLERAARRCRPFDVTLDEVGTFGGKKRGVLWLYPRSSRRRRRRFPDSEPDRRRGERTEGRDDETEDDDDEEEEEEEEPLIRLRRRLELEFPTSTDQRKGGRYAPHVTLSHYANLTDALVAKDETERRWQTRTFRVDSIYVLRREGDGDGGQFEVVAEVPLGEEKGTPATALTSKVHDPPVPFPGMPDVEEDWVKEERMKLKRRRNGGRSRRGGRRRRSRASSSSKRTDGRGPSRSRDAPEVIAAKRAERKAKREKLEREVKELAKALGSE